MRVWVGKEENHCFCSSSCFSSNPACWKSSDGWLLPAPWASHPRQDLCRSPSLRDPRSGAVTGRKYHCPLCLSSPPPEAIRVLPIGTIARPPKRSPRAPSAWLRAHHPNTGNVSHECVFSCQRGRLLENPSTDKSTRKAKICRKSNFRLI